MTAIDLPGMGRGWGQGLADQPQDVLGWIARLGEPYQWSSGGGGDGGGGG
jgi:hypothetical protein